ncbi:MAG TPA: aldehyde dehydrogenase family protein [Acidobacteriota bacterium]|nr:aldehyde dehydrogenase family protein [Acidobacteriota bacterium]
MTVVAERTQAILNKLRLKDVNPGACTGADGWIEEGGKEIVSYNPATGQRIASVIESSPEVYERVVEAASRRFQSWRRVPAPKRGEVVRDLGNALRELKEPLGELVTLEMGKIRAEGLGEVQEMIDICDFAVGQSRQLYGLSMHSERPDHRMYEQWHPMGVAGIITAFNFPVAVWCWNSAIAAICGDTMVWKPSEVTPLCAVAVQHIANRVMADHGLEGVFTFVTGGGGLGRRMVEDRRLPLLSFTGSVSTGRKVAQGVAARLGRTILELGGNNAIIVSRHANLDLAVRAILFGAVGTAGQRCTTTRRIFMQREIAPQLTERLVEAYKQVSIGDPLEESTLMGPLSTPAAMEGMRSALRQIGEQGGEVLCGGRPLPDKGPQFVEPAIVKAPQQLPIVCEETFAPILYLMEYDTLEQAIEMHNAVPQGLSSAIFSDRVQEVERFLSSLGSDCGIANANIGTSGAEIGGAFGGEKDTGGGREAGSDAWKSYMRRQTTTINWSSELPLAQGIEFGSD